MSIFCLGCAFTSTYQRTKGSRFLVKVIALQEHREIVVYWRGKFQCFDKEVKDIVRLWFLFPGTTSQVQGHTKIATD